MKKLILLAAFISSTQLLLAQTSYKAATSVPLQGIETPKGKGKITGTVLDSTNQKPVPFATIALTDPANGKIVDGTICDDQGKFELSKLKEGNYNLAISFIGFNSKSLRNITVSDKKDEVNLGSIIISPSVQQLKEVTVEGQRALIEERVDRTVYNAEQDQTNKGGDATDVLRKVPMLSVDLDGNVSLRGSQNIKVLINNKPSTIIANSVSDALKQIPSDLIKSVEVITSPSAKYDAEGSGGIINIITKKNTLEGATLNVDGSLGYRGSNFGLNGNYRKKKMGFNIGGFGRLGYNVTGSFKNNQVTIDSLNNSLFNTQFADTRNNYGFGRYQLGWDYDINDHNTLAASLRYGFRNFKSFQDFLTTETYQNDELIDRNLRDVRVSDLSGTFDADLSFTHTFKKPQQEFSLLGLYSRNNRTNDFVTNNFSSTDQTVASRLKNENESYNQEITVQADFQTPIGKTQMLELGVKDILRHVESHYNYYFAEGATGEYIPATDRNLANVFNYDQNVASGYTSYTLNFLKTFSLKAGARYEYTTIEAEFQDGEDVQIPSYGTLVPSLNISKKLKNGNTVKAAYNRRIQRPSLQFLNPNLQPINNLNRTIGNPELRPEFTNNYELGYNTFIKRTMLSFSAFMRNTNNAIQSVRTPDEENSNIILTTYQNIGSEDAYGVSVFANINISNKLTLNGGTDVYYAVLKNNVPNPLFSASNEGWVASYRAFGSYNLSKGWGFQLFGFYRARQVQLQGYQGGFGIYSLSLKKDFKNKRGSIGFGAENFFTPSFKMKNELQSPLISQNGFTTFNNMNFKINISYRFGKLSADNNQRPRRRKSVNNDDLKEGGDNGGGGAMQQGGGGPSGGGAPAGGSGQGQKPQQGAPGQKPGGPAPGQQGTNPALSPGEQLQKRETTPAQSVPQQGDKSDSTSTQPPVEGIDKQNNNGKEGQQQNSGEGNDSIPARPSSTPVPNGQGVKP